MTRFRQPRVFAASLGLLLSVPAHAAGTTLPRPNWDRELALQTARMAADDTALREWFRLLRQGQAAELTRFVKDFSTSASPSAPAREKRLYEFTLGLGNFAVSQLPAELVDFLASYTPQTLVAHEENASSAVPLFNIPAVAQGLKNREQRQQAETRSGELLQRQPAQWLRAFLAATPVQRRGFMDSLDTAPAPQLKAVGELALQQLPASPELLAVAGQAAIASADREALQIALRQPGQSEELADILRATDRRFGERDRALVLLTVIESALPENAALAIALLTPGLSRVAEVTDTLFDLLEDSALGASAALALASHPDPAVALRLREMARLADPASARARMALELAGSGR